MPAEMSLFAPTTPDAPIPTERPPSFQTQRPPAPPGPIVEPRPIQSTDDTKTAPPAEAITSTAGISIDAEDGKLLLTEREAAKALSVCPRTLWQLRTDGEIPCIRIGRAVRYHPADLLAWVARRRH